MDDAKGNMLNLPFLLLHSYTTGLKRQLFSENFRELQKPVGLLAKASKAVSKLMSLVTVNSSQLN